MKKENLKHQALMLRLFLTDEGRKKEIKSIVN